jgi:hypothetical protein
MNNPPRLGGLELRSFLKPLQGEGRVGRTRVNY